MQTNFISSLPQTEDQPILLYNSPLPNKSSASALSSDQPNSGDESFKEIDKKMKIKYNFLVPAVAILLKGETKDELSLSTFLRNSFSKFGVIKHIEISALNGKSRAYILYDYYFSALFAVDSVKSILEKIEKDSEMMVDILQADDDFEKQDKISQKKSLADCDTAEQKKVLTDFEKEVKMMNIDKIYLDDSSALLDQSPTKEKTIILNPDADCFLSKSFLAKNKFLGCSNTIIPFTATAFPTEQSSNRFQKVLPQQTYANPFNFCCQNQIQPNYFVRQPSESSFNKFYCSNRTQTNYESYYSNKESSKMDAYWKSNMKKAYYPMDIKFNTESRKEYDLKYVCNYIIQIENEHRFQVKKRILGANGGNLKRIIHDCCIMNGDTTTKIRLRGKGSGYKEGLEDKESEDPLQLCVSSLNYLTYPKCCSMIEKLLKQIYADYAMFLKFVLRKNSIGNVPQKIEKYEYVVTRPQDASLD